MTKAVAKKEETGLAQYAGLMDETPVDSRDFLIPKLLLMQATSGLVKDEKARAGEIRGSVSQTKIAEKEGSVEIIAFSVYKTWVTLLKKGGEFLKQEPMTAQNYNKPREELIDGNECQNYETLNYYCLLPDEIKNGMFMPYVVSFRSTSYQAGKTLETHRARLQEFKKPLPFKTFILGSVAKKNDNGSFFAFTISEGRDTTEAELEAVKHWHAIVKQGGAKVDESELKEKNVTPAGGKGTVTEGDEY